MPTIAVDIENTEQTVTRRVVLDVVYDLIAAFGLPYDVSVIYPNATDPEDLPVAIQRKSDAGPRYNQNMKILVQAEEVFVENDVATMSLKPNEQYPIFYDRDLGVRLTPVYARKELVLTLRIRMPDRNAAMTQIHDMRRHATMHQDGLFHEVEYQYLIPKVNVVILREIHRLRESLAGYDEELGSWLNRGFSEQAVTLSNSDGSYRTLAKDEMQTGILGRYDYEIVPDEPEPNQTKTAHTLNVTYRLSYDKPISTVMSYPILIHNQPIDSRFYDTSLPFELADRLQMPSRTRYNLDQFTKNNYVTGFPMGAPVPTFMDWLPPTVPHSVEGLLRVMVMVDPEDRYDVMSFHELGDLTWRDAYLEYLIAEREHMTKHRHSPFFIALYENERMLGHDAITVDENLSVRSTFAMDLRKRYYVWVGLHTNWELLTEEAAQRLRNNGTLARTLMQGIDPDMPEKDLPGSMSGDYLPRREFEQAIDALNSRRVPVRGEARHLNLRIGHFVVTAL